jgi:hypothetical protein
VVFRQIVAARARAATNHPGYAARVEAERPAVVTDADPAVVARSFDPRTSPSTGGGPPGSTDPTHDDEGGTP